MSKHTYMSAIALAALITSAGGAQTTARVSVAPDSKLWIEGTSTIHDWSCKATTLDASIDVDPSAVQLAAAAPKLLKKVQVKVPVRSLKCGHGGMDDNMYKALKADQAPEISYIMATFDAVEATEEKSDFTLKTVGTLIIAGKENSVTVDVQAHRLADGTIKATGTVPMKMTDFGIQPPTAIFGRIKAGNDVKVKFDFTLGARALASAVEK
jgi:polyisoprenoid-binding protein YceI